MDKWDACAFAVSEDDLEGRICYGGLDLSSTTDITAFVAVILAVRSEITGTVGIEPALAFLCFVALHCSVLSVRAVRRDTKEPAVEDDHRLR